MFHHRYFIFGIKFSWNEGIDTCFNVKCVLHGRNFDFLGGYLVITAGYCSLPDGYSSLLVVTTRSHFNINARKWTSPTRWDRVFFNQFCFFQILIKDRTQCFCMNF